MRRLEIQDRKTREQKLKSDQRKCIRATIDSRRVVVVYYKLVICNHLTLLLRFVVDLLYDLFLQLTRFLTDIARRAVRLR